MYNKTQELLKPPRFRVIDPESEWFGEVFTVADLDYELQDAYFKPKGSCDLERIAFSQIQLIDMVKEGEFLVSTPTMIDAKIGEALTGDLFEERIRNIVEEVIEEKTKEGCCEKIC